MPWVPEVRLPDEAGSKAAAFWGAVLQQLGEGCPGQLAQLKILCVYMHP